jgi:hypothetical protein
MPLFEQYEKHLEQAEIETGEKGVGHSPCIFHIN